MTSRCCVSGATKSSRAARGRPRARVRTRDGSYRFLEFAAICASDGDLLFYWARVLATDYHEGEGTLEVGKLTLDPRARTVTAAGRSLALTVSEFELLKLLITERGTVLRTDDIARAIWGYQSAGSANFLQAHVSRLRRKLKQDGVEDPTMTVRGVGYIVR